MSEFTLLKERDKVARAALYERYDRLNALYEAAEKRLAESHVPRDVDFVFEEEPFDEFNPGMGSLSHSLGFHRLKGKWRIVYGCHSNQMPYPSEWTPIVECSAVTRSEAAHHLDALRVAVVESAEEFVHVDSAGMVESGYGRCSRKP